MPDRRCEILAPAGSPASLAAALAAGADAVYFGVDEGWNARARADNFALADLPTVMTQIHAAGARGYLTMNTLIFEPELTAVERVVRAAAAAGVDALIVQDPAVAAIARAVCPALALHASTQMTLSAPAAAAVAARLGVTRIVAPRELSIEEVAAFAAASPIELEVFIHGALCVSWSGQCLTSEAWGGRSANRGQCAQSCRLPYDLVVDGEVSDLGEVRYLLSPQDLAGAPAVPALVAAGVASLKIEGRLKGPAYVAATVAGYAAARDAAVAGASAETVTEAAADALAAMELAYSRGPSLGFLGGVRPSRRLVESAARPSTAARYLGVGCSRSKARSSVRIECVERRRIRPTVDRAAWSALEGATKRVTADGIGGALFDRRARRSASTCPSRFPAWASASTRAGPRKKSRAAPLRRRACAAGWLAPVWKPPALTCRACGRDHQVFLSSDPRSRPKRRARSTRARRACRAEFPRCSPCEGSEGSSLHVTLKATGPVGRDVTVEGQTPELLTKATGTGPGRRGAL
jgi:putative protease